MNILFLTSHLDTGGITSYCLTLTAGLKEKGHCVYIASGGGEKVEAFIGQGIGHIPVPIRTKQEFHPKVFISFVKLLPEMKKKNIDVIHAHTRVTQVLGSMLAAASRRPYLSTCHGFFQKRLSRSLFSCWGSVIIAISEQVKEHLVNDFGVGESRIRLIHNGIDIGKFRVPDARSRQEARMSLGLEAGPVIGIVARLSDVKGHAYLIKAMAEVVKQEPKATLLIVGQGRMKKDLVRLSNDLNLDKHVVFIDSVSDTLPVLSATDIFVMPSIKEGLGLGLMEAMACGLPVIGSAVGGIKSLIQDGRNGMLVEAANAPQLAGAITELLRDPGKAKELGAAAREFIERNFSRETMVDKTEEAYLECLNKRNS